MKNNVLIFIILFILTLQSYAQNNYKWFDESIPFEERANLLVQAMTLEEKCSQFVSASPAIPRLDVPEYNWWNESLHGVARNGKATIFPQGIAMGATFNPELIKEVSTAISDEAEPNFKFQNL
ncbi:beta-glucosidase [Algibacter lectus]|uniref:Beta-glucosidase n=1 Tax=Algibacter lectus TaxID=221126 RepID=A0A090WUL6_9FLAO|nr:beta-glucosidase [Algibacter lectus]